MEKGPTEDGLHAKIGQLITENDFLSKTQGRWVDNVFIERLWRSLKYEEVYLEAYDSIPVARKEIGDTLIPTASGAGIKAARENSLMRFIRNTLFQSKPTNTLGHSQLRRALIRKPLQ